MTNQVNGYETLQYRRNIIVGGFVVLGLCALVWLIFKFGDLPIAVTKIKSFTVLVQFPSAPGVQKDTPVRLCGYQVGRVTKVMPPAKRKNLNTGMVYHQTLAALSIEKKYSNIPSSVKVKLMSRGLGSSYIELQIDPTKPPKPLIPDKPYTVFLADGMLLQGSTGTASDFFPEESQRKLEELVEGIGTLVKNANDVIGDEANKQNLKTVFANMSDASGKASKTLDRFQEFILTATRMSRELSEAASELRLVLENVNRGEGTLARFVNDGRLYESLLESTDQMGLLLSELKSLAAESREKGIPIKLK